MENEAWSLDQGGDHEYTKVSLYKVHAFLVTDVPKDIRGIPEVQWGLSIGSKPVVSAASLENRELQDIS